MSAYGSPLGSVPGALSNFEGVVTRVMVTRHRRLYCVTVRRAFGL